ncbi:hypothetical protein ARMGADRAFT_610783 [Armillaria gallica]|uniref:NACHT domain-containing protein n=1 Tax=Armillaria gallica TaxID=47427 RepID=A0A2H3D5I7_ARMGA|nr:hypothetical protein ARMGADRAFT_610783 [Armillaria gallica]
MSRRGINESERFQVEVYCRRSKGEYQCLGFCGESIQDVLIGETDIIALSITSNSSCPNISLKIFREGASDYSAITQSSSEDLDMSAAPQSGPSNIVDPESQDTSGLSGLEPEEIPVRSVEDYCAAAGRVVEETVEPTEPPRWISTLIDGIDTVKGMIDAVKDLHPAAAIAWGIVSSCVNVLKQTTERDKTLLRLYKAMITAYKEASDDRLLWQRKQLEPIYKALFQTTNECGMLVMRYTNKNRVRRFFSLDVSQKAEEFIQGFSNLREQLDSGVAKDVLVVTLGVRARVDILGMRMSLWQDLKPAKELGPKSTCMPSTRLETINALSAWIMECNDNVLWCSGLAGTGKSSVVGTLYDLLSFHMSNCKLITSIAYSLGMFDQRIGNAIANALTAYRAALKMPASKSRTQFRLLLQEPLETLRELRDEGPLVIIIDGLDESDVSEDLLEVLAEGFGPTLPFMRLIVSSRPEEKISRVFKKRQRGLHHYPLDTSTDEVKNDIRYFIQQRFASIEDKSVWGIYNEQDVVTRLAERASGLFIWAATVCSFLCAFPGLQRLEALLETTIPADAMEALTILYQTALETIVSEVSGRKEDIRRCIRAVLGTLIVRKDNMSVSMLPELVLQAGDPSAQCIIDKLGSVVQERDGSLELIHKSFDDFLRDHGRCGDGWFIDVEEHEKELARRCVLSLTMFLEKWMPRYDHLERDQAQNGLWVPFCFREEVQTPHHVVLSEGEGYAVEVFRHHLDMVIELGIDSYRSLFGCYFLLWVEILDAFTGYYGDVDVLNSIDYVFLKIIPLVNAEVTDQSLRTYVYHAFSFFKRFYASRASVHDGILLSPSNNFICRDREGCGIDASFDKERLLAVIFWGADKHQSLSVFQSSRYIRSESTTSTARHSVDSPVLFNVDTGKIVEPTSASILCFPDLQLPSHVNISYEQMDASVQIIRLVELTHKFEFSCLNGIQYKVIKRHDSVDDDQGDWTRGLFISIVNTQTSHCDNYLFLGWSKDSCNILQYAQGFFIVDRELGSTFKVEPGTTAGTKKWIILDDCENMHGFTVMEDGSRLLGWTVATEMVSLREWETSTGTLHSDHIHGFPGFKADAKWIYAVKRDNGRHHR